MRIIQLQAENIKGLVAVDITPESELVVLSGENGAGKSSVLDAIYWALAGGKNIQDKPIRDGESKAFIKLDLGELVIERKFTPSGTTLTVSSDKGAVFKKPQEMLDALCGAITFDPMEFAEMKPAAQVETLKSLVDLDIDFDDIERQNAIDYARRTDVNRAVKELEVKVNSQSDALGDTPIPAEKLVISDLSEQVNNLTTQMIDYRRAIKDIDALTLRRDELKKQLSETEYELSTFHLKFEKMPEINEEDIDPIREQIKRAEELNALITQSEVLASNRLELEEKRKESDALTESMTKRNKSVEDAIAAAKMPVEGLSFTKEGILFEGIPFNQCNTGTKIRVSTAVAMATNPELRVIRVERGAWLDQKNMATLQEMAKKHDFQIWIERIADEPMAIRIEEGRVVTE